MFSEDESQEETVALKKSLMWLFARVSFLQLVEL